MAGFAAAVELHGRASKSGAFIESVCLGASIVDAILRVGLVLQSQLDHRTGDIPLDLVLQSPGDKALSEREIFKRAVTRCVIDMVTFDDLQALYDERNRVIHRYVISRITTNDVLAIAIKYEEMVHRLSARLHVIEERQIDAGVGITVRGPAVEGEQGRQFLEETADEKHTSVLARLLRGS
jgi:hypothetical protein